MSCPTCDHTLQCVDGIVFWCPRCGTISKRQDHSEFNDVSTPALIERCRKYEQSIVANLPHSLLGVTAGQAWRVLGVAESINKPGDRPKP